MPDMAPLSGEDDGRNWPEHPVREVEEIFQEAAVAGCIIFRLNGRLYGDIPKCVPMDCVPGPRTGYLQYPQAHDR
jgi:hypothetical protein